MRVFGNRFDPPGGQIVQHGNTVREKHQFAAVRHFQSIGGLQRRQQRPLHTHSRIPLQIENITVTVCGHGCQKRLIGVRQRPGWLSFVRGSPLSRFGVCHRVLVSS